MTDKTRRMRALMSLDAIAGERDSVAPGEEYDASPQQALDDVRTGRGAPVEAKASGRAK